MENKGRNKKKGKEEERKGGGKERKGKLITISYWL